MRPAPSFYNDPFRDFRMLMLGHFHTYTCISLSASSHGTA